jgi:uncharacterized protein YecE (DUF72 family)
MPQSERQIQRSLRAERDQGWKEKITHISQQAEKSFVVANNHFKGQAAVNALELKNMLSGERVKAPKPLVEHYSEQLMAIAEPV